MGPLPRLAERMRDAGASVGTFFCPTAYGTQLAEGKETREINGRQYMLEHPIHGDEALIKAERGDRWGNLIYRIAACNFDPVMAAAAQFTVATVHEIVELGQLNPEAVAPPPGVHVSTIGKCPRGTEASGFKNAV